MVNTNKIILGILILIVVSGVIFAYSFNSNNLQDISSDSSNQFNNSLNDKNNIDSSNVSQNNNSTINTEYSSGCGNNNSTINAEYSSGSGNNKIENNKANIKSNNEINVKHSNRSSNKQTKLLSKKEAYEIAKKVMRDDNPGDTSYIISYSKAKFYNSTSIKYWRFPVYVKGSNEVGAYIYVNIKNGKNWGESLGNQVPKTPVNKKIDTKGYNSNRTVNRNMINETSDNTQNSKNNNDKVVFVSNEGAGFSEKVVNYKNGTSKISI